jgi:hypothetical protein
MNSVNPLLIEQSQEQIAFLLQLAEHLNYVEYNMPVAGISHSSIGKHFRHVVEFYQCFLVGSQTGEIDYDARKRDLQLETDPAFAVQTLKRIGQSLSELQNRSVFVHVAEGRVKIPSTLERELHYNTEHSIHHLAIIRIGVEMAFPHIVLPSELGFAYATINYLNQH